MSFESAAERLMSGLIRSLDSKRTYEQEDFTLIELQYLIAATVKVQ